MARSKKNASLLHPIDTVMHWYAEAQTIPNQLKKSFEGDKEKALQLIKKLTAELKHSRALLKKTRHAQSEAVKNAKHTVTKASKALVRETKAHYQSAIHKVEKLAKELKTARSHLGQAKVKQKYFHALATAFSKVTKLFAKKHSAFSAKKKGKKKRKLVKHAVVKAAPRKKRRKARVAASATSIRRVRKIRRAAKSRVKAHVKKHSPAVRSHKRASKKHAAHSRRR